MAGPPLGPLQACEARGQLGMHENRD